MLVGRRPFLAMTALQDFWSSDDERVFLGEWCLRLLSPSERESIHGVVLPSPWDDPARVAQAYEYLDECYEATLTNLSHYLNVVHQVNYDERYWRIVIGPWLLLYLHALYDRYVTLSSALARYEQLDTIVLEPADFRVPFDLLDATLAIGSDGYNHQLFSQLLTFRGRAYPSRRITSAAARWLDDRPAPKGFVKWRGRLARRVTDALERTVRSQARVVMVDLYVSRRKHWLLALRSGFKAAPAGFRRFRRWTFGTPAASFDGRRLGMVGTGHDSEFGRAAAALLPQNFPRLYLEGYPQALEETRSRHRVEPKVLVSSVGWYFNEQFKMFAAGRAAAGAQLVTLQHGSRYGSLRSEPFERHETRLSDLFLAWGWAEDHRTQNAPSLPLAPMLSLRRRNASDAILFVSGGPICQSQYLVAFDSGPAAGQWERFASWQFRFLAALPDELRRRVRYRSYPHPGEAMVRRRLERRFPELTWDCGAAYADTIRSCRLVVIDHPGTTMLESLAANVPTLLFWDPSLWQLRPSAEPDFADLRRAEVLSSSPEAAAAKVRDVFMIAAEWWETQPRAARDRFVRRQAQSSRDWLSEWSTMLRQWATPGANVQWPSAPSRFVP